MRALLAALLLLAGVAAPARAGMALSLLAAPPGFLMLDLELIAGSCAR